jgi:hypothetical protein
MALSAPLRLPTFEQAPDYRHEITARADRVRFLTIPRRRFLMVDGTDAPGSPAFSEGIGAIYPVAYTLHFALKRRGVTAPVGVLEGLYALGAPNEWSWRVLLPIPEEATDADVAAAIADVAAKKGPATVARLHVEAWEEGQAAQTMHIGPYDAEEPTIERLQLAIKDAGLRPRGWHHEIYISDPNRTAPDRLKTLIRQPVAAHR